MTYLSELAGQVFESLLRNKLRTFLTMAGIAWGIASIVLIVAMGDGFKEGQRANMKSLGENIVILFGGRTEMQAGGERAGRRISRYNSGQFEATGVEAFFPELRTTPIADGRFFSEQDEKNGQRVCVIGVDVKKQLFGSRTDVVGQQVAVNSIPYLIIGVMADKQQNSSYSGLDEKKVW